MLLSHYPLSLKNHGEQETCPVTGEKKSVTPMLKGPEGGPGKLLPSQPQLIPWKGNGRDHCGGPEGSSAIKATAAYNKRNGKMNQFPLN